MLFTTYSTFLGRPGVYIEDIVIRDPFREKGYGTQLKDFILNLAQERGCGRIEWSVLDWNQRAINFYEARGAKPLSEWITYRQTLNPSITNESRLSATL